MCALLLLLFQVCFGCVKKPATDEVVDSKVESISEQEIVEGKQVKRLPLNQIVHNKRNPLLMLML